MVQHRTCSFPPRTLTREGVFVLLVVDIKHVPKPKKRYITHIHF